MIPSVKPFLEAGRGARIATALTKLSGLIPRSERTRAMNPFTCGLCVAGVIAVGVVAFAADPLPPDATYRPLPTLPFSAVKANDEA